MECPKCHYSGSKVVDSRPSDEGRSIRRRRECEDCGARFTTFERLEVTPLLVIKKNGDREEFNRDKIVRGLVRSAEKRPVSLDQIEEIVEQVERKIMQQGVSEIETTLIGEYVMEYLVDVDEISYIRFASVYRQFKDMSVFLKELQEIIGKEKD